MAAGPEVIRDILGLNLTVAEIVKRVDKWHEFARELEKEIGKYKLAREERAFDWANRLAGLPTGEHEEDYYIRQCGFLVQVWSNDFQYDNRTVIMDNEKMHGIIQSQVREDSQSRRPLGLELAMAFAVADALGRDLTAMVSYAEKNQMFVAGFGGNVGGVSGRETQAAVNVLRLFMTDVFRINTTGYVRRHARMLVSDEKPYPELPLELLENLVKATHVVADFVHDFAAHAFPMHRFNMHHDAQRIFGGLKGGFPPEIAHRITSEAGVYYDEALKGRVPPEDLVRYRDSRLKAKLASRTREPAAAGPRNSHSLIRVPQWRRHISSQEAKQAAEMEMILAREYLDLEKSSLRWQPVELRPL